VYESWLEDADRASDPLSDRLGKGLVLHNVLAFAAADDGEILGEDIVLIESPESGLWAVDQGESGGGVTRIEAVGPGAVESALRAVRGAEVG
jgi:predicted RNA-binding protein